MAPHDALVTNQITTISPKTRRRRWTLAFFCAWTVFAALAVVWMLRRSSETGLGFGESWPGEGPSAASQRISDWFKLADLNFHGSYPWILLAPYVFWCGRRFRFERGQWRWSVPAHVAACILFVWASD